MTSADIGVDLGRYKLGWSDEEDYVYKPTKGLDEKLIQEISWMKNEPEWMYTFYHNSFFNTELRNNIEILLFIPETKLIKKIS